MMQRRMVRLLLPPFRTQFSLPQLSKEDEVAAGDDTEVRREDQEKINRFSRLHQRQTVLEGQLKAKLVRALSNNEIEESVIERKVI